jgi:hypothetical protein
VFVVEGGKRNFLGCFSRAGRGCQRLSALLRSRK